MCKPSSTPRQTRVIDDDDDDDDDDDSDVMLMAHSAGEVGG